MINKARAKKELIAKKNFSFFIFCLVFILGSCARVGYEPSGNVQEGLASWYGDDFHGKPTSSKEIYNMYDMTAAHRALPFGTHVMVTNLDNGKSVVVRINDRGPFIKGRIIDLSFAAAKVLDMVVSGVVPVKIEVIEIPSQPKFKQKYSVQVGAFIHKKNATSLKKKLQREFPEVYISVFKTPNQVYYRVRIKAKSMESAQKTAQRLTQKGYTVLVLEEQ